MLIFLDQEIRPCIINAIKASMIPTIESQKTIGLVQLPGMMSGQIIGGQDSIQSVQFQILIVLGLLTTVIVSCVLIGFLIYPTLFNEKIQMVKQGF